MAAQSAFACIGVCGGRECGEVQCTCGRDTSRHVFALPGIVASGKSTVGNILREKGFIVMDADKIGHSLCVAREDAEEACLDCSSFPQVC